MNDPRYPASLVVDVGAIRDNTARLAELTKTEVMAVVKADAYGHGLVPAALAALEGGASFLGVAQVAEALALRTAGVRAPILSWLYSPTMDLGPAVADGIEIGVSTRTCLDVLAHAKEDVGVAARVQLKLDTGLGRNGMLPEYLEHNMIPRLRRYVDSGKIVVTGAFMHFAYADQPTHPTVVAQQDTFARCVDMLEEAGFDLRWTHVANTAACLAGTTEDRPWNLVRPGLGIYGHSPMPDTHPAHEFGLRPAMRATARSANLKGVPAGTGISYAHTYTTSEDTRIVVVPVGYADGVPRAGSNKLPVSINGQRFTCAGRVCMDQFVIDVGEGDVGAGAEIVLFGDGSNGTPTVEEWADAAGTISYDVLCSMGRSLPRRYVNV